MIHKKQGNILSNTSGIIVHGCNAQGVMCSGIAKQIKEMYPAAYATYKQEEQFSGLKLGTYSTYCAIPEVNNELFIVNMITQKRYGNVGKKYVSYDAIDEGFTKLFAELETTGIQNLPVRFPAIGAGLGVGNLDVILSIVQSRDPLDQFEKELWVLE